jgi:protein TonB
MDASRKRSRGAVIVLVAAVHLGLLYVLTRSLASHVNAMHRFAVPPLRISFIIQPRLPLLVKPERLPAKPHLARIQVALLQPLPALHLHMTAEPVPSAGPAPHATGSPVRHGRIGPLGAPLALTIAHYVAPAYPRAAVRLRDHGSVVMALRVNAHWGVGKVKILRSSGSVLLDRAAVHAARRWKFVPLSGIARHRAIWGVVQILFAPPQQLLGVSVIIMPYAAIARELAAAIAKNRGRHLRAPPAQAAVRTLLHKIVAAYPGEPAGRRDAGKHPPGEAIEAELAARGPLESITFLGFLRHGARHDRSGMYGTGYALQRAGARWQAYAIKQTRGSSVWLVASGASGKIERIEVAMQ